MAFILLDSSVVFDHLNGRYGRTLQDRSLHRQLGMFAVTPAIARQAGLLRRDWRTKGQTLSYTDVTIAAVAIANDIPLLTDNRKHFPMPDLQLFPLPDRLMF